MQQEFSKDEAILKSMAKKYVSDFDSDCSEGFDLPAFRKAFLVVLRQQCSVRNLDPKHVELYAHESEDMMYETCDLIGEDSDLEALMQDYLLYIGVTPDPTEDASEVPFFDDPHSIQ